ncbi:MAG: hypothetical protein WDZ49_13105 [Litorilinea sp.]
MSTQILALFDDEQTADKAAKAIDDLDYEDLSWEFITTDSDDVRIVPGISSRHSADLTDPVGFVQETDPPTSYALDDLDLDDAEKEFFAQGLEGNAIVFKVDAPDEAVDQVEQILRDHNAGRYTEA